jgi:hypothetical protein
MAQPVLGVQCRSFNLSHPNPPFKIYGDNLDMWTLREVKCRSGACQWPATATILAVNKNFIQVRANPTPNPAPPPAPAHGHGAAPAVANGSDDLTVTLCFDDDDGNPVEMEITCDEVEYLP